MQILADSDVLVPPPPAVEAAVPRVPRPPCPVRDEMLPIAGPGELTEILQTGTARRYSGELRLVGSTDRAKVCLYNGGIAWAQCTTRSQHLGDVLAREAGISPAELARAMAHCRETGRKLGHVLVRLGMIEYSRLRQCLGLHVAAHLKQALGLAGPLRGRFDFVPDHHYDRALTFTLAELVPAVI